MAPFHCTVFDDTSSLSSALQAVDDNFGPKATTVFQLRAFDEKQAIVVAQCLHSFVCGMLSAAAITRTV